MPLSEVIKQTIGYFNTTKEPMRPDRYRQIFCAEAKKQGLNLPEMSVVERAIKKLDLPLQKYALSQNIKTEDELLLFLIYELNFFAVQRKNNSQNLSIIIIKKLLHIVEQLSSLLAPEAKFSSSRDLSHHAILLDEASRWTLIDKEFVAPTEHTLDISPVVSVLLRSLNLVLTPIISDQLQILEQQLADNPQLIMRSEILNEINTMLDHYDMKSPIKHVKHIEKYISVFQNSLLKQSQKNSDQTENDLSNTVYIDQQKIKPPPSNQPQNREQLLTLIDQLKIELQKYKNEAREDLITNALSRRAIEEELNEFEKTFLHEKTDYLAAFIEIDSFEHLVNDIGLKSAETLLNIVVRFVKSRLPNSARFGHYSGRTFLCLIDHTSVDIFKQTLDAICVMLSGKKFVYENRTIIVTLSIGLVSRVANKDLESFLSAALEYLINAKNDGGSLVKINP